MLEKNSFENERYKQYTSLLHSSYEEALKDKDSQMLKIFLDRIQAKENVKVIKNNKLLEENNNLIYKYSRKKEKIKALKEKVKFSIFHSEKYNEHINMIRQ